MIVGRFATIIVSDAEACCRLLSVTVYVITYVPACDNVGVQLKLLVVVCGTEAFSPVAVAPTGTPIAFRVTLVFALVLVPVAVNETGDPTSIVCGPTGFNVIVGNAPTGFTNFISRSIGVSATIV